MTVHSQHRARKMSITFDMALVEDRVIDGKPARVSYQLDTELAINMSNSNAFHVMSHAIHWATGEDMDYCGRLNETEIVAAIGYMAEEVERVDSLYKSAVRGLRAGEASRLEYERARLNQMIVLFCAARDQNRQISWS